MSRMAFCIPVVFGVKSEKTKQVIFPSLSLPPELWVRHACSSATPPMPFLENTSPQCEYLRLQPSENDLFIYVRLGADHHKRSIVCLHPCFLYSHCMIKVASYLSVAFFRWKFGCLPDRL